ncbi:site-specific tyrosine recombinase XerC [Rubripirellula lacrimiformis]|uniref:Site-specific tyrosine recombinase XerC n=1 Tax=Rubripirellula lacrimiformis TaxID=1930273 RepID=A0A517NLJ8_9BACT|nr:tyrosine-type recombinase/integrase [Rubripirellula lacrimiformis]QDT07959.1 site-specific tyrosine recombinase XerC [Rubripirellula lacrimiformis]
MGTLYRRGRNSKKSNWLADYTLHTGKRTSRSTGTPDKKTAAQILAHWETEEAKRASGLVDPVAERIGIQSARSIAEHKAEWIASLKSKSRDQKYVNKTETKLQAIVDHAGWKTAYSITPESVEAFVASLHELNRSNQTIAHYVQAVKQFTRWLTRTGRIHANPLETVTKPNPSSDRRRERRMLLPAEWSWLQRVAGDRAMIYELTIETGLRSGEIRSLHPSHVKHDAKQPYITVRSSITKDSKQARQYITKDLSTRLASRKPHTRQVFFELPDEYGMAGMLRGDLAIARAQWLERPDFKDEDHESDFLVSENDAGERLDFHALRHTCGAWLAVAGVHPKTIQTVMRHKTITLTMDTYGHLFPDAEPQAIEKLGCILRQ